MDTIKEEAREARDPLECLFGQIFGLCRNERGKFQHGDAKNVLMGQLSGNHVHPPSSSLILCVTCVVAMSALRGKVTCHYVMWR